MNIKNIKGSLALKTICLVLIIALAISTFAIFAPSFLASAKTNSDLWGKTSTAVIENNKITTSSDDNATVKYNPSVYMDGFNLKFKLTSNDFEKFIVSFTSTATLESKLVGNVTTNVNLSKKADGKIVASLDEETGIDINANFYNTELNLTYDKAANEFKLNGTSIGKVASGFYLDIADTMQIKMQKIAVDKVASVELINICGQNLNASFEDKEAPIIKVDAEKVPDTVCVGNTIKLPFKAMDKLSKNDELEYTLNVKYSATLEGIETATETAKVVKAGKTIEDAFIAEKEGFYAATLTVKDTISGKEAVQKFDVIKSVKSTMSEIVFAEGFEPEYNQIQELGEYFKMPKPDFTYTIAEGITSNQAKVAVQYKSSSSTSWYPSLSSLKEIQDENTLLAVKGLEKGEYKVRYVILDSRGENPEYSAEYKVYFYDSVAPTIRVEGFVEEAIINKAYSVTVMTATDKGTSNITKTTKVFFIGEEGEEEIEIVSNAFTPTKLGDYKVVYTAKDVSGNETTLEKEFKVVEDTTTAVSNPLSAVEIVLICIAGVALVGIVLLFVIKPKKR